MVPAPNVAEAAQTSDRVTSGKFRRDLAGSVSNHLRQVRAPGAALAVEVSGLLPRAVGRDLVRPLEQLNDPIGRSDRIYRK